MLAPRRYTAITGKLCGEKEKQLGRVKLTKLFEWQRERMRRINLGMKMTTQALISFHFGQTKNERRGRDSQLGFCRFWVERKKLLLEVLVFPLHSDKTCYLSSPFYSFFHYHPLSRFSLPYSYFSERGGGGGDATCVNNADSLCLTGCLRSFGLDTDAQNECEMD